jgi:tetratricopeptide (TPR) repeat protein
MLETIREFAAEQLTASDEVGRIRDRHATYFTQLAEEARPALLKGHAYRLWLERLDMELANLRAAFTWMVNHNDAATAFLLAVSLEIFWDTRGHLQEACQWLERVSALPGEVAPDLRADAFRTLGFFSRELGEYDRAHQCLEQAIALYYETNNLAGLADAYCRAGGLAMYRGDYTQATNLNEHALVVARTAGDPHRVAASLGSLSIVAMIAAGAAWLVRQRPLAAGAAAG